MTKEGTGKPLILYEVSFDIIGYKIVEIWAESEKEAIEDAKYAKGDVEVTEHKNPSAEEMDRDEEDEE